MTLPGPGTYQTSGDPYSSSLKYSIRPRTAAYSSFGGTGKGIPGPGTYELDALSI